MPVTKQTDYRGDITHRPKCNELFAMKQDNYRFDISHLPVFDDYLLWNKIKTCSVSAKVQNCLLWNTPVNALILLIDQSPMNCLLWNKIIARLGASHWSKFDSLLWKRGLMCFPLVIVYLCFEQDDELFIHRKEQCICYKTRELIK